MISPPGLANDCFALPRGVDWTPVDRALAHLRERVRPVAPVETVAAAEALGRFLAGDVRAARAHPPAANSAVDGYGFAAASLEAGEVKILELAPGRAAAGAPAPGSVPAGHAIRILTGAPLPEGVDTVVLDEDVAVEDGQVAFRGDMRRGANTRAAGEDVEAGQVAAARGTRLRPQELGLLASVGVAEVPVHRPLRVGVLSTGDEIAPAGAGGEAGSGLVPDANRPMLVALLGEWGLEPVDLGHVPDDREALARRLDEGAGRADAIMATGGASAGDEDHVSALLGETGSLGVWRIAVKPGRPLALGMWRGVPVFGLPGNPVAAFVCALVFGAPALRVMGGGSWAEPARVSVPAAFAKSKKAGRREYLRARLTGDGAAEAFPSEGSGRVSGLAWASGLVEIGDGAREIRPGDPVDYIPFEAFRP